MNPVLSVRFWIMFISFRIISFFVNSGSISFLYTNPHSLRSTLHFVNERNSNGSVSCRGNMGSYIESVGKTHSLNKHRNRVIVDGGHHAYSLISAIISSVNRNEFSEACEVTVNNGVTRLHRVAACNVLRSVPIGSCSRSFICMMLQNIVTPTYTAGAAAIHARHGSAVFIFLALHI